MLAFVPLGELLVAVEVQIESVALRHILGCELLEDPRVSTSSLRCMKCDPRLQSSLFPWP